MENQTRYSRNRFHIARPWAARASLFVAIVLGFPAAVEAQSEMPQCFEDEVSASGTAAAFLSSPVRVQADCEYSLRSNQGYREIGGSEALSFLELLGRLGWSQAGLPVVYARRRASGEATDTGAVSSVSLAHCTDYVMQAQGPFEVRPSANARRLTVRRASSRCGAGDMTLDFSCSVDRQSTRLGRGSATLTLPECGGAWQVQARAGGATAYMLGELRSGRPTDLLAYFGAPRSGGSLFIPDFVTFERGFALRRGPDAEDALWGELQLAVAAGSLRFMRGDGDEPCESGTEVEARALPGRVEFDFAPMRELMVERHGVSGAGFVPGEADWSEFLSSMHLCLPSSHGLHEATVRSKSLGEVAPLATVSAASVERSFCVNAPRYALSPSGAQAAGVEQQCMNTGDGAALMTTTGAAVPQIPPGVVLCRGERRLVGDDISLTRGVYELRVQTAALCRGSAGLSVGRIVVLDPARDWAPVGVRRQVAGGVGDELPAWRGARVAEPDSFGFVRGEDALRFSVAAPGGAAAAWNAAVGQRPSVLSEQAPVVGLETGSYGQAGPSALAVAVTSSASCPLEESGELVREDMVGPAASFVNDQKFYSHLVLRHAGDSRCLARAAFRVRSSRVIWHHALNNRFRLQSRLLGDPRIGVFMGTPDPLAVGALLPVVELGLRMPHGFTATASVPITAAIAFDGRASRVGPGLLLDIAWGLDGSAPDLVSLGAMVHAPWPHPDDTFFSVVASLNLGALYDLAGGR